MTRQRTRDKRWEKAELGGDKPHRCKFLKKVVRDRKDLAVLLEEFLDTQQIDDYGGAIDGVRQLFAAILEHCEQEAEDDDRYYHRNMLALAKAAEAALNYATKHHYEG